MGGCLRFLGLVAVVLAAGAAARAEGFAVDYSLAGTGSGPQLRLAPSLALGGDMSTAGLSLQAGRNWFGQLGLGQGAGAAPLNHGGTNDIFNLAGGYRFGNGQSLSLQLSRGRGAGQRLGLAVNYDWPRYFVRFSFDQQQGITITPTESLRLSAGMRF